MNSEVINVAIDEMRSSLRSNVYGHIEWGRRLLFWKLLRLTFPVDSLFRYDVLAYRIVRSVIALWRPETQFADSRAASQNLLNEVPNGVLRMYRESLLTNDESRENLLLWRNCLRSKEWDGCMDSLVSDSILRAFVEVTARIEHPEMWPSCFDQHRDLLGDLDFTQERVACAVDELSGNHDPYYFDYEYWISYAASLMRDDTHCPERRRAFWVHWLDECSRVVSLSRSDLWEELATDQP